LWSRGAQELEALFPGIRGELVAAGATVCDDGDLSQMSIRVSGHELNRSGKFKDPASVVIHLLSRPLLESQVRRRVSAIDNVEILDGHDFVEPITPNPQRVTGAHIVDRDSGAERTLDTDLVVDAMGRSARTPAYSTAWATDGRPPSDRRPARTTPACCCASPPGSCARK
jgi:2-polyprenyl-6-methoxyphenol hydroxylase-like FAD-dependent oxidoreductase